MTIGEIYVLRSQGRVEDAYEAARSLYADDKGPQVSTIMFLTASDVRQKRLDAGMLEEADKIGRALKRLQQQTPEHLLLGCWGEETAAAYLCDKGYIIMERDWHSGHRDIDIIARYDGCLVFIEVKTRHDRDYIEPELAVNYQKKKNLRLSINHYVKYHRVSVPWRFDVITIIGSLGDSAPEINHIEDFSII
jgi:Holliday junction resolvase-like predicted endonuclease